MFQQASTSNASSNNEANVSTALTSYGINTSTDILENQAPIQRIKTEVIEIAEDLALSEATRNEINCNQPKSYVNHFDIPPHTGTSDATASPAEYNAVHGVVYNGDKSTQPETHLNNFDILPATASSNAIDSLIEYHTFYEAAHNGNKSTQPETRLNNFDILAATASSKAIDSLVNYHKFYEAAYKGFKSSQPETHFNQFDFSSAAELSELIDLPAEYHTFYEAARNENKTTEPETHYNHFDSLTATESSKTIDLPAEFHAFYEAARSGIKSETQLNYFHTPSATASSTITSRQAGYTNGLYVDQTSYPHSNSMTASLSNNFNSIKIKSEFNDPTPLYHTNTSLSNSYPMSSSMNTFNSTLGHITIKKEHSDILPSSDEHRASFEGQNNVSIPPLTENSHILHHPTSTINNSYSTDSSKNSVYQYSPMLPYNQSNINSTGNPAATSTITNAHNLEARDTSAIGIVGGVTSNIGNTSNPSLQTTTAHSNISKSEVAYHGPYASQPMCAGEADVIDLTSHDGLNLRAQPISRITIANNLNKMSRGRNMQPNRPYPSPVNLTRGSTINNIERSLDKIASRFNDKLPANRSAHYNELLALEQGSGYVLNMERFDCIICYTTIEKYKGVVLRNCLHQFCKSCLVNTILHTDNVNIPCPYAGNEFTCQDFLKDQEIRALLKKADHEKYLQRSVRLAETSSNNTFHCKALNCTGWCFVEGEITDFVCPCCSSKNCVRCEAIHTPHNCEEYQEYLKSDKKTRESVDSIRNLLKNKRAKRCPKCQAVIIKNGGCDNMRCTACNTSFNWKTTKITPNGYLPMNMNVLRTQQALVAMRTRQINEMNRINQMNQMNQTHQTHQMNQMNQPNQINQTNQMNQMNQINMNLLWW